MGFVKQELVTIQCDNCKDSYQDEDSGYGFWINKDDAWQCADDDGWTSDFEKDNEKHYCQKCHHYNDEDELIINTERTNENA